jgi:hypothetical protein
MQDHEIHCTDALVPDVKESVECDDALFAQCLLSSNPVTVQGSISATTQFRLVDAGFVISRWYCRDKDNVDVVKETTITKQGAPIALFRK